MSNFEKISKNNVSRGYSVEETINLFGEDKPILTLVSSQLELKNKFVDNKPTNEVLSSVVYVAMPESDINPFVVKLPADYKLDNLKFGDKVVFEDLKTCKFSNYRYYFKADNMVKA